MDYSLLMWSPPPVINLFIYKAHENSSYLRIRNHIVTEVMNMNHLSYRLGAPLIVVQ